VDRFRRLGYAVSLAGALVLGSSSGGAGATARTALPARDQVNPIFRPILTNLKGLLITVLLQTYLPHQHDAGVHLSATVDDLSRFGYLVDIGYTPHCDGVDACRLGSITGGAELNAPTVFDYPRAHHVRLHSGKQALYFPFTCGASCGDSVLAFQMDGIVYTVTVHGGSLAEVLNMANSVTVAGTP